MHHQDQFFYLCTSTNFWKTTCQNLPHFHSYFQWSYHHGTIPSVPIIQDVKWKSPWYIIAVFKIVGTAGTLQLFLGVVAAKLQTIVSHSFLHRFLGYFK